MSNQKEMELVAILSRECPKVSPMEIVAAAVRLWRLSQRIKRYNSLGRLDRRRNQAWMRARDEVINLTRRIGLGNVRVTIEDRPIVLTFPSRYSNSWGSCQYWIG